MYLTVSHGQVVSSTAGGTIGQTSSSGSSRKHRSLLKGNVLDKTSAHLCSYIVISAFMWHVAGHLKYKTS
jgi:hypothetical protein